MGFFQLEIECVAEGNQFVYQLVGGGDPPAADAEWPKCRTSNYTNC